MGRLAWDLGEEQKRPGEEGAMRTPGQKAEGLRGPPGRTQTARERHDSKSEAGRGKEPGSGTKELGLGTRFGRMWSWPEGGTASEVRKRWGLSRQSEKRGAPEKGRAGPQQRNTGSPEMPPAEAATAHRFRKRDTLWTFAEIEKACRRDTGSVAQTSISQVCLSNTQEHSSTPGRMLDSR